MRNYKFHSGALILSALVLSIIIYSFTSRRQRPVAAADTRSCLIVSDIHFSPLFGSSEKDTALKRKLLAWSLDNWKVYFEGKPAEMQLDSNMLFKDANYAILESAMANMKRKLPNPALIVIAGDFIWHNATPADSLLKKKTIQFIAQLFKENFPGTLIIPAMGNNDTYGNDYDLQDPKFLDDFADAWAPNLPQASGDSLKKNGYYSCEQGNLKFLVMNSALLYAKANHPDTAALMLKWVKASLAGANGKDIWIVMHIPPGVNGYNGQDFWRKEYARDFVNTVAKYSSTVRFVICSHVHFDDFKVIYSSGKKPAPVSFIRLVASVCSNHGNYPSFEIARLNTGDSVTNETSWYLNLSKVRRGIVPQLVPWADSINLKTNFKMNAISATAFSELINTIKADKSGQAIKSYANFYDLGSPIGVLTINKDTYLRYLKADSLRASQ